MRKNWRLLLLSFLLLIPLACSSSSPNAKAAKTEITISAAASLKDALDELKPAFEKQYPQTQLTFNFGSSGKLAQQIEQGAPVDVFLSASEKDMDTLQNKNLINKETRANFSKNELVLITAKDSPLNVSAFNQINPAKIGHFAIGETESVPVGRYAKQTLQKIDLWGPLQNKLVMGSDVRQVLAFVESGNAELGIVYATDALISKKVKVLAEAKPDWHKPIVYPGAVIADTKHADEAKVFLTYLTSDAGQSILKKYGFK
jgi:molybdate transport system substrate-binding protein